MKTDSAPGLHYPSWSSLRSIPKSRSAILVIHCRNNDNSNEFDEFEDDEMAALDVDNIVMTHKSMIFSQSVG